MEPTREELEVIGKNNLEWIESQQLYVLGVNIFQILSYELIQMMNNNSLKEMLGGKAATSDTNIV